MRKMLITFGAVIAALALSGVPAVTASAAPVPVIYNDAAGWSNPAVRPHWVIIGQGGAPMAHTWWWNTWNSTVAKSAGTLWVDNCIPDCALGKTSYHKLYVTLSGVKWHKGRPQVSSQVPGRLAPAPRARAAGPKARIQQGAAPRRAGGDVPAALLKSLQRLAIAERECRLQARAFPHLGKVQHRVDQARAAAWSDVPGLGAQRHPGGPARFCGDDHLGGGDGAAIVADLDVLMQVMIRPWDASRHGSRSRCGRAAVRRAHRGAGPARCAGRGGGAQLGLHRP